MSELGQQIIAKIREHAAASPYPYDAPEEGVGCVYVYDGAASCLVGKALWDLELIGPELETDISQVIDQDSTCATQPNSATAPTLLNYLGLDVDGAEAEWIRQVQSEQDSGTRWDVAVAEADTPNGAVV